MNRTLTMMASAVAACASGAALACGACVEDGVAATYDHAVINTATARHQQVVFVAVGGPISAEKLNARIAVAASRVHGVQAGTLRLSISPPAFSFALDAAQEPEAAVAGFRKAVGDSGAHLTLVRIMRNGTLIEPH
jgi:hypothetical protein